MVFKSKGFLVTMMSAIHRIMSIGSAVVTATPPVS